MLLDHRTAVVTGAAAGIGAAIAERLAESGAQVVLADVDADEGAALAARLNGRGLAACFVRCDVGDLDAIADLKDQAVALHGRVDILVNKRATSPTRCCSCPATWPPASPASS